MQSRRRRSRSSTHSSPIPSATRSPRSWPVSLPDPRRLRPGPAPVRRVVRATRTEAVCRTAGRHRVRWPASTATPTRKGRLSPSPAAHVRRPRIDYESHPTGLDRNEVGALLVAAGLASARDHALISLLAINGLRVSEALGVTIEALGIERGHRTLIVLRKGGKTVVIPLAPRTARAIDLASANGSKTRSSCARRSLRQPLPVAPQARRRARGDSRRANERSCSRSRVAIRQMISP